MHFIYITLLVVVVVQFSLQNVIKSEKQNRIYKGTTAEAHSAPYMAIIVIKLGNDLTMCGGALIKPKFVLTAGHCLQNVSSIKVYVGVKSLFQSFKNQNWVEILTYRIHKLYNPITFKNDIAIIKLLMPIVLNNKIALIRLPKKSDSTALAGKYGRLTGHGSISDDKTQVAEHLMELKVRIVNTENCNGILIHSTQICGYGEDSGSSCNGDSGSPLVLENTDILIGIDSFGTNKLCTKGYPHVYTHVASYLDWIRRWSK